MNWLTWKTGRRNTGYRKLLLFQWPWYIPWDLYVLCFPPISSAPTHTDPVPGFRHYRINFVIKRARSGGKFKASSYVYQGTRLNIFRSDRPHEVEQIIEGTRYVLSLGICFPEDDNS